jgi:predicted PurR-regulated permease PerM
MSLDFTKAIKLLLFFFLLSVLLHYGKPFLVPVVFGGLFAMLFLPVAKQMERRMNKALAAVICIAGLLLLVGGLIALLSWQVSDLASDASKIEQQLTKNIELVKTQVSERLGISPQKQQQMLQEQQSASSGKLAGQVTAVLNSTASILANCVLVLVYIFLFLYFRSRLRNFVLMLVPPDRKTEANEVMSGAREVAQKYLAGLAMMIVCLWVLYGIGFTIVGVKNALFFAILCGLFEIVPFIGNLAGTALTVLMVMAQGGSAGMVIGVLATYAVVQTFQTYILEPLIVGSNVNINPLFTILVLVFGEFLWGVPGMVLAIPVLGIIKIVCDHVRSLQPVGYVIGEDRKSGTSGFTDKIKKLFS